MDPLRTETAAMQTEAGNFDRIAGELTTVMNQVGMTASGLAASMQGAAGMAAQAALTRFEEAGRQQTQLLTGSAADAAKQLVVKLRDEARVLQ